MLFRSHGVTVAAKTLQNLVFRCIYSYRNAELQLMAERQGEISPLTPGERKMAMDRNNEPRPQARAWEYWCTRLAKKGELPTPPKAEKKSSAKAKAKKRR